ncbi:hypothetical protein TrVE_jg3330 [Triparma verrucosa]|uniref:SAM domain-containing protein n=1 Tax=Triparma verrucosa TaxID=1606542 RepID=A0A9W7FF70_9STRA|nr:hypothetical protein TrVE_jg3330 [Triparma verrucosa]
MATLSHPLLTPTKENAPPSALNIEKSLNINSAATNKSGIISPTTLGKKLRVKRSKLVETNMVSSPTNNSNSIPTPVEEPARPYSPEHYAPEVTSDDSGLTLVKTRDLTDVRGSNRYADVDDDDDVVVVDNPNDNDSDEGMMPGEAVKRSSEGLKRSQSEPGNSFMFSSPGGHTPAGSAAGVVKNKLKMKMENISEISDLSQFFDSIRISPDVATQYLKVMVESGYDDVLSLEDATEEDLCSIGVKAGHAKRMKRASSMANKSKDNAASVLSRTQPEVRVRGKSAGEERTDTFEADIKRAEEIRRKGRAKSAVGKEMAKKELTLKYDPAASVNDMDYAKTKLQAQAAKIRELEAKLAENVMDEGHATVAVKATATSTATANNTTTNAKKLTAEERLQAHKNRKAAEINATAKQGQWQAPPPKEEGIKKVKQNDALLDRLTCKNNEERRDREKAKALEKKRAKAAAAKQKKMMQGSGSAPPPPMDGIESPAPGAMRSEVGKEVAAAVRKTAPNLTGGGSSKPKLTAQERKDALLARLSLSTAERRATTEGSADDKVKKALAGHKLKKKKFDMATVYDPAAAACETCGSKEECEEDVDTPGTFYCKKCWDEYEEDAGGADSGTTQLRRSMSELKNKPAPVSTGAVKHDQLPTSPPTKQEAAKQLKSPPPAPPVNKSVEVTTSDAIPDYLWIIHDNPTLPSQIQKRQLPVMIETKDGRPDWVRIIMGTIQSCGRVKDNDRGTESLMVKDLMGYYVNKVECETRVQNGDGNIIEFRLEKEGSLALSGDDATMSVKAFLKGCKSRVDVILDPHSDGGEWFPLKEANRSMAPQFKSNGVGYLRLGDDMSKNGVAFLSEDDCESFFSEENVSPTAMAGMGRETPKAVTSTTAAQQLQQTFSADDEEDADELDFGEEEIEGSPTEIIKTLQEAVAVGIGSGAGAAALKWHEKVDLITRLGKLVSMAKGREFASSSLVTLQDMLKAKNVNVHVLRAIVVSIGRIGWGIKAELTKTPSWRTIILDLLKLLKSKQVAIEAKQTLKMLHGRCFGLKQVLGFLNQALGRGKSAGGGSKKGGKAPAKAAGKAAGNAAVTEIVEWIADSVEDERHGNLLCGASDKSTIENIAGLFMSCVNNRDVKCRRAAQEGLVGVLVLGVAGGNFDRVSVLSLIDEIEKSNAKMHSSIVKLVKEELASLGVKSARAASAGRARQGQQGARGASAGRVRKAEGESLEGPGGGGEGGASMEGEVKKTEAVQECARRWGEVQYLLRKPPMQAADIERVVSEAKQGIYFLETLDAESQRLGMLRGALSRCVLPYDENTSTLDQANVANGPALQSDLDKVDLGEGVMNRMRDGAIALRGLIRVKIADDNDLDLAAVALKDVVDFFALLKKAAGAGGKEESYKLLRTL